MPGPLLLLLAACGGAPVPGGAVEVRITPPPAEARFGEPFPLTVVRRWDPGLVAREWDDGALAPLVLRSVEVATRVTAGRTEETRRFHAFAFRRGEVRVPALRFEAVPKDGGRARVAAAEPFALTVRPGLSATAPGEIEPPPGPLSLPRSPWWALLIAAAAAGGGALLLGRSRGRRRVPPPAPPPPPVDPAVAARAEALGRLRALRGRAPAGEEAIRADFEEVAVIARTWLDAARGLRTRESTTEEIAAAAGPALRPGIAAVLGPADLVKFAAARPGPAERTALLDAAEALAAGEGSA